jgi:hypothetical protein
MAFKTHRWVKLHSRNTFLAKFIHLGSDSVTVREIFKNTAENTVYAIKYCMLPDQHAASSSEVCDTLKSYTLDMQSVINTHTVPSLH